MLRRIIGPENSTMTSIGYTADRVYSGNTHERKDRLDKL